MKSKKEKEGYSVDSQAEEVITDVLDLPEIPEELKTPETEEEKPKKKRGRPAGKRKKAPTVQLPETRALFESLFTVVAARNPIWKLSDDELTALSVSTDAVLNKYGASFGKYAEEISLGVTVMMIFVPRVIATAKERRSGWKFWQRRDRERAESERPTE